MSWGEPRLGGENKGWDFRPQIPSSRSHPVLLQCNPCFYFSLKHITSAIVPADHI